MIQEIIQKWEQNKDKLKDYFRSTNDYNGSYQSILKAIFHRCLDPDGEDWDIDRMTVIDDGDYQGSQLFFIPAKTYQPSPYEYIFTHTYYGSCSGCDTLQAINEYTDDLPTPEQVNDYMQLALHLVQKLKRLTDNND